MIHREGDVHLVPDHTIGEADGDHLRIGREVTAEEARELAVELVLDGDPVRGAHDLDHQVMALARGEDVGGGELGEAQEVRAARLQRLLEVLDGVVAEADAQHIGVAAIGAADELVAAGDVEQVVARGAGDQRVRRRVQDDPLLVHAEPFGNRYDIERQAGNLLIGGGDLLEQELLGQAFLRLGAVVGVEDLEDRVPLRQVVARGGGIGWRAFQDGAQHRHHLAVRGRVEHVRRHVVADAVEVILEPALHREPQRHGAAHVHVLADHVVEEADGGLDHAEVAAIGVGGRLALRQAEATRGVEQLTGDRVTRGGQQFRPELDAVELRGEAELVDRHHLGAVGTVVGAGGFVQRVEVDGVVAQPEARGPTLHMLQFQRAVEVGGPDEEAAERVLHIDAVLGDDAVLQVDRDTVERQASEVVMAQYLLLPGSAGRPRRRKHLRQTGTVDLRAARAGDGRAAQQGPVGAARVGRR